MEPKIVGSLFVGVNCFGMTLPIISPRVSLPAYVYSGE